MLDKITQFNVEHFINKYINLIFIGIVVLAFFNSTLPIVAITVVSIFIVKRNILKQRRIGCLTHLFNNFHHYTQLKDKFKQDDNGNFKHEGIKKFFAQKGREFDHTYYQDRLRYHYEHILRALREFEIYGTKEESNEVKKIVRSMKYSKTYDLEPISSKIKEYMGLLEDDVTNDKDLAWWFDLDMYVKKG